MGRLNNKIAFVTGGASGLGEAMVRCFVAEGAKVVFGDIDDTRGQALAKEVGADYLHQDVADESRWKEVIGHIEKNHGRLHILVNNAGILGTGTLENIELEAWNRLLAINLTGVMLGCKYGAQLMTKNPEGESASIINISSIAGLLAGVDCGYAATKGAVRLFTKSIASGFARRRVPIRCNSIHPGQTETPILYKAVNNDPVALNSLKETVKGFIPMGRLGRPEEIAAMALYLASDESSFCTGSEFVADGGATCSIEDFWQ